MTAAMILPCPQCGQKNRIPFARLHEPAQCGACHGPLGPLATPLDVTSDQLEEAIREAKVPILVDFWAAWCGPCRVAAPEVAKTAQQMSGRALVLKVNTEQEPAAAARHSVRGIPHFEVFRQGTLAFAQAGLVGSAQMCSWLDRPSRDAH